MINTDNHFLYVFFRFIKEQIITAIQYSKAGSKDSISSLIGELQEACKQVYTSTVTTVVVLLLSLCLLILK